MKKQNSILKTIGVFIIGVIGLIYVLNPTAGVIEMIPDNFPIIGNLDEAAAIALVLGALRYFGFDITKFFSREKVEDPKE